jgi:hypothetical protein
MAFILQSISHEKPLADKFPKRHREVPFNGPKV